MSPALLVPFTIGVLAVLQVGLNRRIAGAVGLLPAVILNAGVLLVVAVLVWVYARAAKVPLGEWMSGNGSALGFSWWWLVPGLCGLSLVAGMPWAMQRVGALSAFVVLVAAQMLFSLVWDQFVEHVGVSAQRLIGACLAILGALVTTFHR